MVAVKRSVVRIQPPPRPLAVLTVDHISILRTLLQDHLNTLSDISCHYVPGQPVPNGYLDQLRELELTLIQMENGMET